MGCMSENARGKADADKYATPKSGSDKSQLDDEKWLRQRYWDNGLTLTEIAERCNCAHNTVLYWINKHNIPTREPGKELSDARLTDQQWFERQYYDKGKSTTEIANICGCAPETAREWKRKHGLETNTNHKDRGSGSDNPNWRGGNRVYGPNWKEQREKALDRDRYKCQDCGADNLSLHVHYIIPRTNFVGENGELDYKRANQLRNLVVLCGSCHNKWEGIPIKPDNRHGR